MQNSERSGGEFPRRVANSAVAAGWARCNSTPVKRKPSTHRFEEAECCENLILLFLKRNIPHLKCEFQSDVTTIEAVTSRRVPKWTFRKSLPQSRGFLAKQQVISERRLAIPPREVTRRCWEALRLRLAMTLRRLRREQLTLLIKPELLKNVTNLSKGTMSQKRSPRSYSKAIPEWIVGNESFYSRATWVGGGRESVWRSACCSRSRSVANSCCSCVKGP